jgi:RNA polymerase sigma-70 factor, ECF subfamily
VFTPATNPLLSIRLTAAEAEKSVPAQDRASRDIAHLTRRLAAGEEEAFREFHSIYFSRVYQFLLSITHGCDHEAQDALQQTFLRIVRYVRVFDFEDKFWSWVKMVARSAARDAGRKQKRYSGLLERFALYWKTPQPDSTEETHLQGILEESLSELDQQDRLLLEQKYIEELTVKELSASSGESEKAIESRLLRLRRQLRHRILKGLKKS